MGVLGKEPGGKGEREGGKGRESQEVYAGVLVFRLLHVLKADKDVDVTTIFQV